MIYRVSDDWILLLFLLVLVLVLYSIELVFGNTFSAVIGELLCFGHGIELEIIAQIEHENSTEQKRTENGRNWVDIDIEMDCGNYSNRSRERNKMEIKWNQCMRIGLEWVDYWTERWIRLGEVGSELNWIELNPCSVVVYFSYLFLFFYELRSELEELEESRSPTSGTQLKRIPLIWWIRNLPLSFPGFRTFKERKNERFKQHSHTDEHSEINTRTIHKSQVNFKFKVREIQMQESKHIEEQYKSMYNLYVCMYDLVLFNFVLQQKSSVRKCVSLGFCDGLISITWSNRTENSGIIFE